MSAEAVSPIALVVGGAGAIGSAVATRLSDDGWRVLIADLVVATAALGTPITGTAADVCDPDSVREIFQWAEAAHGPIRAMVYCAGGTGVGEAPPSLSTTTTEQWVETEALNARGAFLCIREYLYCREVRPIADGRILAIGSIAGQVANSRSGVCYAAAKASLQALIRFAATEGGPMGITANLLAPGPIDTPALRATANAQALAGLAESGPVRRLGIVQDVAATVAFLASMGAGYTTGATIDVNGGRRMQ